MRARELELTLVALTGRAGADLDFRMRSLRNFRLLPTGGRGESAPQINAGHAANVLIGVAGCVKPAEAARAVVDFAPLRPVKSFDEHVRVKLGTFAEELEALLSDTEAAGTVDKVILFHGTVRAEILFRADTCRPPLMFFREGDIATKGADELHQIGNDTVQFAGSIAGVVLVQLAVSIAGDRASGAVVNFEAAKFSKRGTS